MTTMYVARIPQSSFFSRLDVRTKLLFVFLVSTLIFVWQNVIYMAALFGVVLLLALGAHMEWRAIRQLLLPMIPFTIIVLLLYGLWSPYGVTPLLAVPAWVPVIGGHLTLYWEGLTFGLLVIFRMLAPLLALPLVVMTTDVNDLVVGLVRLRIPYKVAFIFSIALRFVPFIFNEVNAIMEAQRLRGLALEKMSYVQRIKVFARLGVPLVLGALLKAQTLEVVLQSKAFSGSPDRTFLNELQLQPIDYLLIIGGISFLLGAIVARLTLGWGAF